jgi:hypothetical protein
MRMIRGVTVTWWPAGRSHRICGRLRRSGCMKVSAGRSELVGFFRRSCISLTSGVVRDLGVSLTCM